MNIVKKSSVSINNGSLKTTIPKILCEVLEIKDKSKLEWNLNDSELKVKIIK